MSFTRRKLFQAEPVGSSPAEQDAMLKKQVAQFRPIIQELGVTLD